MTGKVPVVPDRRLVLDASVFLSHVDVEGVTAPSVLDEVKGETSRLFLDTHPPEVVEPAGEFVGDAREAAGATGDLPVLSRTDLDVLGLALELREEGEDVTVVTDDYAVQNVAAALGLEFRSIEQEGIEEVFEWEWFCPACGRVYDDYVEHCPVCGTELKRRRSG